jgi:ribosomal protein S18 acetylase RimI-like enzyme
VDALGQQHERSSFHCGEGALDRYLQTQATQDIRRRVAQCFVAVETSTDRVVAFYTLSAASIPLADLPPEDAKRLPRYPAVPAVRIGRLAVDLQFQGRCLGEAMLADANARALKAEIAAVMLLVDAKDENAVAFYERYGFRIVAGQTRMLFLPLATAEKAFKSS